MADELAASGALPGHHRLPAVRGHLLERAGRRAEAAEAFAAAAALAGNPAERRHLAECAQRAAGPEPEPGPEPGPGPDRAVEGSSRPA